MADYEKGSRVDSPKLVLELILDGKQLYRGDKLLTRKWLMNQTVHDLVYWAAMGQLSSAVPVEEEDD